MRTLRVYFTAFLLLSIAALSACRLYPGGHSGPPPDLIVVQANDLDTIGTNPKILGRDGGYSGVFGGFAVWIYGDTFLANPNAQGQTLISDSWAFTADLNAPGGITGFQEREDSVGAPSMLLQLTAAEQAFNAAHQGSSCEQPCGARWALWPGAIVADPARNRALVFYQLVSARARQFQFSDGRLFDSDLAELRRPASTARHQSKRGTSRFAVQRKPAQLRRVRPRESVTPFTPTAATTPNSLSPAFSAESRSKMFSTSAPGPSTRATALGPAT